MKVGALVHFAMPWRNAGSETVLHLYLRALVKAGHEVRCWVTDCPGERERFFEGVHLIPVRNVTVGLTEMRRWGAEIAISHHQNSTTTQRYFKGHSVYLTHNDMDINRLPLRFKPGLVVHNSEWVKNSLSRYGPQRREIVIHPPLDCERHRVDSTGPAITLINLNEHKGGKILFELASRMPDVPFIGQTGGHGVQLRPPRSLNNLTILPHNPDLKPVWRATRVLLMPSIYESYGLVGIEAGCNGIPTIANPTPGLRESLGSCGLFVDREDIEGYEKIIRALLDDEKAYGEASVATRANSERLCAESAAGVDLFVREVENLSNAL